MEPLDLNELRRKVRENQERDTPRPTAQADKVYADRDGRVRMGGDADLDEHELSVIPQDVWSCR